MTSSLDSVESFLAEDAKTDESEKAIPKLGRLGSFRAWGSAAAKNATVAATRATSSVVTATTATASSAAKIPQVLGFVKDNFDHDDGEDEQIATTLASENGSEKIVELRRALGAESVDTLSDDFILKCLVQHYGNVAKATEVARGFLTFRKSVSWPLRIEAQDVELALRTGMHWLLPVKNDRLQNWTGGGGDTSGPAACLVYNASRLDVRICPVEEYQKMGSFLMERATDCKATQERGIALIVDNAGVELLPMLRIMSLADMKRGVLMWKGAFPCRVRRLWVVDAPKGSGTVVTQLLKLLAPKIQERICFARREDEKGLSALVEDLGGNFELPRSLGGDNEFDWEEAVATWLIKEQSSASSSEPAPL